MIAIFPHAQNSADICSESWGGNLGQAPVFSVLALREGVTSGTQGCQWSAWATCDQTQHAHSSPAWKSYGWNTNVTTDLLLERVGFLLEVSFRSVKSINTVCTRTISVITHSCVRFLRHFPWSARFWPVLWAQLAAHAIFLKKYCFSVRLVRVMEHREKKHCTWSTFWASALRPSLWRFTEPVPPSP